MASSTPNLNLKQIEGKKKSIGFLHTARFLTMTEVEEAMIQYGRRPRNTPPSMLFTINGLKSNPFWEVMRDHPPMLTISKLKHVTSSDHFKGIVQDGSFKGSESDISMDSRHQFEKLSWWSADIPPEGAEDVRSQGYMAFSKQFPDAEIIMEGIKKQFANSPVFDAGSRFGNFVFTFPIQMLLSAYSKQCCDGSDPVLRVLGTWMYKLEIVHAVLIHSPNYNERFSDLPEIQTDHNQPLCCNEEGEIKWRPESSSNNLKPQAESLSMYPQPCVWNNPEFAFHLPGDSTLSFTKEEILEHVSACIAIEPSLNETTSIEEAQQIIEETKKETKY